MAANTISRTSLKQVLREIVWPRRWLVLLGIALTLVAQLARLVLPASTKYFFDGVIANGDTALLLLLGGTVGGAVAIQAAASYALTVLLAIEGHRVVAGLRSQVQEHMLKLPVRFFDHAKSGELISRVMDVDGVATIIGPGVSQLVGGAVTVVVGFVFLVQVDFVMTVLAVVPLASLAWISRGALKRMRPAFRERRRIRAEVTARLTEEVGGIRIIKGFDATEVEGKVFHAGAMKILAKTATTLRMSGILASGTTFFTGAAGVLVLMYGGQLVVSGEITTGELVSFTAFLAMLVAPVSQMTRVGVELADVLAGLDRSAELLSLPEESKDPRRVVTMPPIQGRMAFEDVYFRYEPDKPVLKGVSFEARPGMVVALVGSSGAGKSTVASLAGSFWSPDAGRVLVDGIDLREVELASYRKQLGLVLQDDFLFDGTIRDNIRFARPSASDVEVERAAEQAWVTDFADRLPDGLDTVIGERGIKLSGGQRQRVTIGRAVLADPRILILDEATSSLDTESEKLIQKSLAQLTQGRTTLVIAHRLSTIRSADLILVMEDGRIVERGDHDELMARGLRYHQLHTVQARI